VVRVEKAGDGRDGEVVGRVEGRPERPQRPWRHDHYRSGHVLRCIAHGVVGVYGVSALVVML
jgi:hypothetical protein